ncbi:hypothetical protein B0I37DRAFT_80990 [Chaetomium sp. MPI-CAGE-AT-0009]|nr:hypothetical protein B0I37DRAFT_80990 [Chaetomium sp. MPI-CAGE-AT-0009]
MPTYLCHGFRWQRRSVRVYVILQNLDDASPEWIIPAKSSQCILKSFYEVFEFLPYCSPKRGRYTPTRELDSGDGDDDDDGRVPNSSNSSTKARSQSRSRGRSQSQSTQQSRSQSRANHQPPLPPLPTTTDDSSSASISAEDDFGAQSWSAIKLLEEYDPNDLTAVSRPYAYVADYAVRIDLSCSIIDEIAKYEQKQLQSAHPAVSIPSGESPSQSQGWFESLRDELQHGEEIRWYVVVNNDEVRDWADEGSESTTSSGPPERGYQHQPDQTYQQPQQQQPPQHQSQHQSQHQPPPGRPIPSREQRQHHAQYIHQQHIFEGSDREKDQVPEKVQAIERNGQEQKRGPQQQQQQQPLVFGESDQQRKHDEEKRQQQLLLQKREQQRKQEEEKRQEQLNLEQAQRQREREQEEEQQRLAWRELELRKARQRERERQRQREREKELERERERERERGRKREEEKHRQRDQRPPETNGADTNGKPPMVPEKDFFFPRPPTAKSNPNPHTNAPPPLRQKISIDFGRPKTPGGKGGGLRRLFLRTKVPVDGGFSP